MSRKHNFQDIQKSISIAYDASGRHRTTQARIWGDYKHLNDKRAELFDEVTNGTATSTLNNSMVNMEVLADEDYVLRKSFSAHPYRAGFSMFHEFTFCNFHTQANVVKEVGYFTTDFTGDYSTGIDGYRFFNDGTTHRLQVYIGGQLLYDLSREEWDDPMDGTESSRINYNFEKFTIFAVDWLWLGGSQFRFWIFIQGRGFYNFHTIEHAGTEGATGVVMISPQKPVRYGIRSTGGEGIFTMICSSFVTEGNHSEAGHGFGVNTGETFINCNATDTRYAVIGVRLKEGFEDEVIIVDHLSALASTNDNYVWELVDNPTLAGAAPTWTELASCAIEYAVADSGGTNTVTNGHIIHSGISNADQALNEATIPLTRPGVKFDGTRRAFWLVVRPLSINLDIYGAINGKRL